MITFIYVLKDGDAVRYVGKTTQKPLERLKQHLRRTSGNNHRENWTRQMQRDGKRPTMEIVDTVEGDGSVEEIATIARLRKQGCDLVNATDGGEGRLGKRGPMAEAIRQKIAASNTGKVHSDETRKKLREARQQYLNRRGTWNQSEEAKRKIGEANKNNVGNTHNDQAKAKISDASKAMWERRKAEGWKHSETTRNIMSEAKRLHWKQGAYEGRGTFVA